MMNSTCAPASSASRARKSVIAPFRLSSRAPQFFGELLESHQGVESLFDREAQVFPDEGAVNVSLVGFDYRVCLDVLVLLAHAVRPSAFSRHYITRSRAARLSSKLFLVSGVNQAAGDDCGDGRASKRPAVEGRVAALGFRARGVERPFQIGVENRHVAPRAGAERAAAFEAEDARRVRGEEFDETLQPDASAVDEPFEGEADGRFQAGDAEGR